MRARRDLKEVLFDFNVIGKNGYSPLHYAVFHQNLVAVELLIKIESVEDIDMNRLDNDGK